MTTQNNFAATIHGTPYSVDSSLKGYDLAAPKGSYVHYFATNEAEKTLVIQFNNGNCFKYKEVPKEVMQGIKNAASAGSYFHKAIKDKFESEPAGSDLFQAAGDEDEDDDLLGELYYEI